MIEKEIVEKELEKLIDIREAMFAYFDANLPQDSQGGIDFSKNPTLPAKEIYEHCFKLDYQARKIRAFLVNNYKLNP